MGCSFARDRRRDLLREMGNSEPLKSALNLNVSARAAEQSSGRSIFGCWAQSSLFGGVCRNICLVYRDGNIPQYFANAESVGKHIKKEANGLYIFRPPESNGIRWCQAENVSVLDVDTSEHVCLDSIL